MARETKDERDAREAREQLAAEAALAEYFRSVPKRILDAQSLARSLGVTVAVDLIETGPSVRFYRDDQHIDETITYETEQWLLEWLERRLREIKTEQDRKNSQVELAKTAWADRLSPEERTAIKEHIAHLR